MVKAAKTDEEKKVARENYNTHFNTIKPIMENDAEAKAIVKNIMEKCD